MHRCLSALATLVLTVVVLNSSVSAQEVFYEAEDVFPLRSEHNHAPGIVELPNGDFLCSWYRGSGERKSDDVAVLGALKKQGSNEWGPEFLMADYPGFPDCNTAMMVDSDERLWLFWPIILANTWESCLTNYMVTSEFDEQGRPVWGRHGVIFLKPDNFENELMDHMDRVLAARKEPLSERQAAYVAQFRRLAGDKLFQRLGWQPRCKPTVLPSGRILLPLYTDTFSVCIMAISDDNGRSWYPSKPIIGYGNIQASVVRRDDGTLVAYMRDNGFDRKIQMSESKDDGITWSICEPMDIPNPGAGLDAVRLENGHWALIYNDIPNGRNKLAVSISDDEGKTWKWTRRLEDQDSGSYHYPVIIQGKNGNLHAVYSYFTKKADGKEGKTMKHVEFNEEWVKAGSK